MPIPVMPLSIWNPIHLGTDETGQHVNVSLAERNMLIGGEPGGGKSVALQLIVAHGALSADCKLILIDGKRVELGLWAECAEKFVGPSIDDAIDVMHWLQGLIDERTDLLLQMKKRKVTPDLGWPFYLVPIDEVAYFSATVGTPDPAEGIQRQQPGCRRPRPRTRHHPRRSHPAALAPTSSPPRCATCSATGGPSAAPPKHPPTPSSATAGPTTATQPPRSTPRHAACPGCAPKTASLAASRPPTSPTTRSSTWPPGPPQARATTRSSRQAAPNVIELRREGDAA